MGFFSEKTITYKNPQVRVQKNYPENEEERGGGKGDRGIILFARRGGGRGDYVNLISLILPDPLKMPHDASEFTKITF